MAGPALAPPVVDGVKQVILGAAMKYGISAPTLMKAANLPAPTAVKMPTAEAPAQNFTTGVLKGIGAPVNPGTTSALNEWIAAEGGGPSNPLNTTLGQGSAQGSAIKGYGTVPAGINATVTTLKNGLYQPVLQAFKSDDPTAIKQAIIASPWDGSNHYAGTDYRASLGGAASSVPVSQAAAAAPKPALPTTTAATGETTKDALTQLLLSSGGKALSSSQLLGAYQPPAAVSPLATPTLPAAPTQGVGDPVAGKTPMPTTAYAELVADANKISGSGYNYEWGGGHNTTFAPTTGTGHGSGAGVGYDCSGAISAVLHAAGLLKQPMVAQQFMTYGHAGPGGPHDLTIYASPTHVFAEINGKFFGTSLQNPGGGAAWFAQAQTAGYTVRHVSLQGAPAMHLNTQTGNVIPFKAAA